MTNEEALNYFERRKELLSLSDLVQEAEDCALSAIKKQVPENPIKSDREIRYCEVWKCPACEFEFSGRVVDYCYRCGQKIDWSDI